MPNIDNVLRILKGTPSSRVRPEAHGRQSKPVAAALVALVLACLGLTACGGSSGNSTNAASTGTGATSAAAGSAGGSSTGGSSQQANGARAGAGRFSAIRECLQKNGVTLPKPTPGSGGRGTFSRAGGGPALPKGMTRPQFEAALKKCGGSNFGARFGGAGGPQRVNSPVFKQALAKYAECLRQNGVNLPAPNTSGKGPIFSTKGIDTASPQFKAATMKCRGTLVSAFRRPAGGAGNAGGGTPPAGGGSSAGGEGTPSG